MVDQKKREQVAYPNDYAPQDPDRRKFIKAIVGGVGIAALGGGFWLARGFSKQDEAPSATANNEPVPSVQTETTTPQSSTTVNSAEVPPSSIDTPKTPQISLESLPTSAEDPELWVSNTYANMNALYSSGDYELMDYIFNGGEGGIFGSYVKNRINRLRSGAQGQEEDIRISGRLIEAEATLANGGGPVRVEETLFAPGLLDPRLYPDGEEKRILDFFLTTPIEVEFDSNGNSEMVTLYLIGGMVEVCTYDKDGNCNN